MSAKSVLQEYAQKAGQALPVYTTESSGDPHNVTFTAHVHYHADCATVATATGMGHTKKAAEQSAARVACAALGLERPPSFTEQMSGLSISAIRQQLTPEEELESMVSRIVELDLTSRAIKLLAERLH